MDPQAPNPEQQNPLMTVGEQPKADPLAGVPVKNETMDTTDDEAITRRSSMYAMGQFDKIPIQQDSTLWDTYALNRALMADQMKLMGDSMYRKEAEQRALGDTVNSFTDLANNALDESSRQASRIALAYHLQEKANQKAQDAAERQWAESVVALRQANEPVKAELSIMQHDTPDVLDNLIDIQTVRAMMMRKVEENNVKVKDRNWFLWAMDAAMYFLPFATTAAHVGTYQSKQNSLGDYILSGERFESDANSMWRAALSTRNIDDRQAIIDVAFNNINRLVSTGLGPNELLRMELMHGMGVTPTINETNAVDLLQNLPTIGTFAHIGWKAFNTPFRMTNVLKAFGNSTKVTEVVEEVASAMQKESAAAVEAKAGMKLAEVEDNILPDQLNPDKVSTGNAAVDSIDPPVHANDTPLVINDHLENGRRAFEDIMGGPLLTVTRMSDEEKAAVLADAVARAQKFAINAKDKRPVINQRMVTETLANGSEVNHIEMTIGRRMAKGESVWYADEASAKKQLARIGMNGDGKVVKIAGEEGYGLAIRLPVDETGKSLGGARFFTPFADKAAAGPFSPIVRFISGGQVGGAKELRGLAQMSYDKRNKINTAIRKHLLPNFYALNKAEKDVLGAVMIKGERDAVWYDDGQLERFFRANFGQKEDPSKFIKAYHTAKDINDIEFYLRNVNEGVELNSTGHELISWVGLGMEPGETGKIGKVFRLLSDVPEEVIWDVEKNQARIQKSSKGIGDNTRLSAEHLQKMQQDGYVLVRLQKPLKMADGTRARFFLVKGSSMHTERLPHQLVPYYPGGHRMYSSTYFVKKGVMGKQPWGDVFHDSPFTPTTSLTLAESKEWAEAANSIQAAYRSAREANLDGKELIKAVQDKIDNLDSQLGYPDAEEFIKWMDTYNDYNKGGLPDTPFEAVYDRELPSMYAGTDTFDAASQWGESLSGMNTFMQTQGRMYMSKKGPILRNITDWSKTAETYDPYTTLNTALTQIARMSSFTDFKIRAVQKWISTYGHALDTADGSSMMKTFLEGKFKTGTKNLQAVKNAAELQRSYIKRILGWKSDFDLSVDSGIRQVVEWVAGDTVGARSKLTHQAYNWVEEKKPLNAAMGLAFDATMGFFNIAQYPLQAQTAYAAASIDATKGLQAFTNLPFIQLWMRKAADESTLDWLISKGVHTMSGFTDPNEYRLMMKTLKQSGWLDNMMGAMKNEFGPNAALGAIGQGLDDFRRAGRFFTNVAEEHNRSIAYQMAWRMVREKFPDMEMGTPLFNERVRNMAGTLGINMDEAGAAAWQRNPIARIPTQFMPYMFRWHEVLLDDNLTAIQKARFVAGQAFMYGTAGLPFAAWYFAEQEKNSGKTPKIGTFEGTLDRGFADTLIWYATGADVTFSERAGIGMYPTDMIQELLGGGRYGDTSAAQIMMGASGQIWGQFFDASFKAMWYAAMESGGESGYALTEQNLKRAARSISSLNNILKAEAILNYGEYTNRKGEASLQGLPDQYAFAALLGMAPAEFQQQTAQMGWLEKRKERVEDWTEQVMILRTRFGEAMKSGDYNKADEIGKDANFVMRYLVPKDIKADVLDKAYKDPRTRTVAEAINERYTKEKNAGEFIKRTQQ